jgi:drug/metabolite transporter (DMT)-like permease
MTKLILLLLVGLVFEALGVVLISRGLKCIGPIEPWTWAAAGRLAAKGLTQPSLMLGILFEAIFFGILLYLLAQRDVSLVWPLTSLGFVLTALMARFLLGEQISMVRWTGVILIMLGAALVSWSELLKTEQNQPASVLSSSDS